MKQKRTTWIYIIKKTLLIDSVHAKKYEVQINFKKTGTETDVFSVRIKLTITIK